MVMGDRIPVKAEQVRVGVAHVADHAREHGEDDNGPGGPDAASAHAGQVDADATETVSEERLHVSVDTEDAGVARLHKTISTETVSETVPVSHEEVVVEHEPITEENVGQALAGGELTEEEHEVTLRAERPVVEKEIVPVERVRLGTRTVTEEQMVSGEVTREHVDANPTHRGDAAVDSGAGTAGPG